MPPYLSQPPTGATSESGAGVRAPDLAALAAVRPWTEAQRQASLEATLAARPDAGPIRVFAYGSLIWRPAFEPVAEVPARLPGWYRHTCLWSISARGTPDRPGLMFGLDADPARQCLGIAQTVDPDDAAAALASLWRREMHGGVYRPCWLEAMIEGTDKPADGRPVWVLAFAVNHDAGQYAGDLPVEMAARYIAGATGELGGCADYYANTADALRARGIVDPEIETLVTAVERVRARF